MSEQPRLAAAAALRALNSAFVAHQGSDQLLERITAFASQAVEEFRSTERRDRASLLPLHAERMFRPNPARNNGRLSVNPKTDRAVGGTTNPISIDFDFEYGDNEVVVRTVFGAAYEGAPGRAHGGMVAAVFDDITGFLLPLVGSAAYTGQLTVRYHRPVPIGTPLEFRSRIDSHEGRKLHVTADCHAGDELVASADVLFITVDTGRFGQAPDSRAAPAS